jgi:hypothetical protein
VYLVLLLLSWRILGRQFKTLTPTALSAVQLQTTVISMSDGIREKILAMTQPRLVHSDIVIGILLAHKSKETRGRVVLETWVSAARAHGMIVIFFGAFEDEVCEGSFPGGNSLEIFVMVFRSFQW